MTTDGLIGRQFGNYRLERLLGQGGMAQVYYGCDIALERPVAIKVMQGQADENQARHFVQEARMMARWRHPHIVQIYAAGEADGRFYFVMEYIDGPDLAQWLAAQPAPLPFAEALRIGTAVAAALDYAHAQGVVHRDVKPKNILLAQDGRIMLTDFGLALAAGGGSAGDGTPHYMAPEQVRQNTQATPQTDIYALGVTLFEMLTGHLPFADPSAAAVALQQVTQPPPSPCQLRPDLGQAAASVLLRALAKDPNERYENGRTLMAALAQALTIADATDELLGQQLDEYRLETLLGQGGMARIYRGYDQRLQRYAAIKVIAVSHRDSEAYRARFQQEAQAIARLEQPEAHPNIVRLYRYGEVNDLFYMAMQYIEGENLRQRLDRYQQQGQQMPPSELLSIICEVCAALDFAHARGIVHRDVKPANIMINATGRAFLTDFGLALPDARQTKGEVFGSPQYIAPEQAISSAAAVPQSDLYAVGVILYEVVTGRLPFAAADPLDTAMMHMGEPPPPPQQFRPDLSPDVAAVILRCLDKDPAQRYATGQALCAALTAAFDPVKTAPPTPNKERPPAWRAEAAEKPQASKQTPVVGLPPIPAAVVLAEAETIPPPSTAATRPSRRRGCLVGWAILLLLTAVPILLWFTVWAQGQRAPAPLLAALPAGWVVLPTHTATATQPPQPTNTAAPTATVTLPATATMTLTPTGTAAAPPTATTTSAATPTTSPTATAVPTATASPTPLPTAALPTATALLTATPLPTATAVLTTTRAQDNMPMIFVPGTTFMMGAADTDELAEADERPVHAVTVSSFYMDQHEVTVAQYAAFLNALGSYVNACSGFTCLSTQFETTNSYLTDNGVVYIAQPGFANYPINNVSWYGAQAYCAWAGARLPTEAEWELAARGVDGRLYPWGDDAPDADRAIFGSAFADLQPAHTRPFGNTPEGITGLAGSLWEWVADGYDAAYYAVSPPENPTGTAVTAMTPRVLRGGGYDSGSHDLRASNRYSALPSEFRGIANIGFRCVTTGE